MSYFNTLSLIFYQTSITHGQIGAIEVQMKLKMSFDPFFYYKFGHIVHLSDHDGKKK